MPTSIASRSENEKVRCAKCVARLLRVRVPLTTITPSRAQRKPGALRPAHWARGLQAGIRASYLPQNATPVVCAVSVPPVVVPAKDDTPAGSWGVRKDHGADLGGVGA